MSFLTRKRQNLRSESVSKSPGTRGGEKMSDSRFKPGDTRINYAGGPTKEKQVKEWYKNHPGGSVSACARDLDISRPTARKWKPTEQAEPTKKPGKLSRILNILKE